MPLGDEFQEGVGQLSNELVVQIDIIVEAVVTNDGLLGLDHGFNDQCESHFQFVQVVAAFVTIDDFVQFSLAFFIFLS